MMRGIPEEGAVVVYPPSGPFVPGTELRIEGAGTGPLRGLTFAAKDLFDVAGHPTGGGNPDWAAAHAVPEAHAWAVGHLLDRGRPVLESAPARRFRFSCQRSAEISPAAVRETRTGLHSQLH